MAKKWKDLIASLPAERQEAIAMETRRLAAELPLQNSVRLASLRRLL